MDSGEPQCPWGLVSQQQEGHGECTQGYRRVRLVRTGKEGEGKGEGGKEDGSINQSASSPHLFIPPLCVCVQVAYPKHHTQADISDIYLLATATKGVFVNVALQVSLG